MNYTIQTYKKSVLAFTDAFAQMIKLRKLLEEEDGFIPEASVEETLMDIKEKREQLLAVKDALGYDGGVDFVEEITRFKGFSIEKGLLVGDISSCIQIISPWLEEFPQKWSNYQFEIASLVLSQVVMEE